MRQEKWYAPAAALALFGVNALLVFRLAGIEYTRHMGSIEAAYIGLARYIQNHLGDLDWFPLWYGGIPYQDSYPPLLHFAVAAAGAASGISAGLAYHAVTALVYALGPVALFWTARRLGAGLKAAFLGGLFYSLLSPSCWLVREVRADTNGWFGPRRLVTLVPYGEGPHLTSLLFLPLAIGMIHVALEKRRPLYYVTAALAIAGVVLSNWIGGFALALGAGAYLLAGYGDAWLPRWLRAAGMAVFAYAIALPWATPSTIATIRANAPLVGGKFETGPVHRAVVAAFICSVLLLAWVLKRWRVPPQARFGVLFLLGTTWITLGGYWFHFRLLPQPERYHLEMDMAFWLLAALAAGPALAYARSRFGFAAFRWNRAAAGILIAGAAVAVPVAVRQYRIARSIEEPVAIASTAEYQVSRWLETHMPGRRVFAPGTIGFWMNAFSDTPMLTGGFDNGERNTFLQDVIFQIYAGDKQEIALDWLRAFGCDAIVGAGRESREVYHPYYHPDKFQGLPELWRSGPEVIYAVGRRRPSLAHAMLSSDLVETRPPAYATRPFMDRYLAALENESLPPADFEWKGASRAVITASLRPEHLLSVQVTWDEGWSATVNGEPRAVRGDKLGQMVVEPKCSGACTVELLYDGGLEMKAAKAANRVALATGLIWILGTLTWRRRSASIKTS